MFDEYKIEVLQALLADALRPSHLRSLPDYKVTVLRSIKSDIDAMAEGWTVGLYWSVEDVQQAEPAISEKDAKTVLKYAKNKHDANVGVNWDVLGEIANMVVKGNIVT